MESYKIGNDNNDIATKRVRKCVVKGVISRPFLGSLSLQLNIKFAPESDQQGGWCDTAATDGFNIYFSKKFVEKLTDEECEFVLAHELYHVIFNHVGASRMGIRNPKLWNAAADYVINDLLINENIGQMPKVGLHDTKYHGMFTEEVYNHLLQKYGGDENIPNCGQCQKDANGNPVPGQGSEKDGKDAGDLKTLDQHLHGKNEAERKKIMNNVKKALRKARMTTGGRGLADPVKKMVDDFLDPKMDWRQWIRVVVESKFQNDYSWRRPHKRSWSNRQGIIFPSLTPAERVEIVVFLDTSGSISSDQIGMFLSEIVGIMTTFSDYQIRVFQFDDTVFGERTFSTENLDDMAEVAQYREEVKGNGGTNFEAIWEYLKEHEIVPKQLLVFTDGMPGSSWGEDMGGPTYCDTLWIIVDNPRCEPPFGDYVHYNDFK